MTEARLWLNLIGQWIPQGMGNTGPTLPFLIGATRVVGLKSGAGDISELSELLYTLQNSQNFHIRIAKCSNLGQPVARLHDRNETMAGNELIRRTRGTSSLYVSMDYPHTQNIDSVISIFQQQIETAITNEQWSYSNGRYGSYQHREREFIQNCANGQQKPY